MKKYWEIAILFLSVYVIVQLALEMAIPFSQDVILNFELADTIICFIFLSDFGYSFYLSKDKKAFVQSHWIDLLSSIPFLAIFRVFRITRIIRLVRILKLIKMLRGIKAISPIIRFITKNKLRSILFSYALIMSVILIYCSIAFYYIEKEVNDLIHSYLDSLWWSFITVTSVGYGDVYPKTHEGRLIAVVLTLTGMGMFSLITAELSAKFLKYLNEEKKHDLSSQIEDEN